MRQIVFASPPLPACRIIEEMEYLEPVDQALLVDAFRSVAHRDLIRAVERGPTTRLKQEKPLLFQALKTAQLRGVQAAAVAVVGASGALRTPSGPSEKIIRDAILRMRFRDYLAAVVQDAVSNIGARVISFFRR